MYSSCKIWKSLLNNPDFIAFFKTYFLPKTTPFLTFLPIFNEKKLLFYQNLCFGWVMDLFLFCVVVVFLPKKGHPAKIAVLALHKNYLNGIWKRATSPAIPIGTRLSFQGMLEVNLIICAKKHHISIISSSITLTVVSATVLLVSFACLKESTCEARKNAFLFHFESSFRSWDKISFYFFRYPNVIKSHQMPKHETQNTY